MSDFEIEEMFGVPSVGKEFPSLVLHTAWEREGRAWVVVDVRKLGRGHQVLLEAADSKDKQAVRYADLLKKYKPIELPVPYYIEMPRVALP